MRYMETNIRGLMSPFILGYVYLLKSYNEYYGDVYKIGITKNEVSQRVAGLKTGNSNDIEVKYVYACKIKPSKLESRLHRRYKTLFGFRGVV